ncbi:MAG: 3-oxoacyl-ACP synthase [Alphaproteobacteria bacterium]|nr:3-oxoacyl-ACP synthase [Alphaproteobacteria bacterium]
MSNNVFINGLGAFLPGDPVPSSEMEDYLGCINGKPSRHRALVLRQNKIKTRHYALNKEGEPQYSSADMAAEAINQAVQNSEISKNDITYLASASTLGDVLVPGLASHVHAKLKILPIEIANFQSVCASSLMAIKTAFLQIKSGEHECAAVCGSEFASRYFRPGFYEGTNQVNEDGKLSLDADFLRFTLSDGAGALIMESGQNTKDLSLKVCWIDIRSFADRFETCMVGGGRKQDAGMKAWGDYSDPAEAKKDGALMLTQDFDLMKRMIPVWVSHYLDLIDQEKIVIDEIDHVCSHYSSHSLREETITLLKKTGAMIDEEKWFSNLYSKGNTGSASIFIMLEELYREGGLQKGEKILCHVPESGRSVNGLMLLEVV